MAAEEVLRAVTLDRLLECELNAQEAFLVLRTLEEALRGAPDTVQAPVVSSSVGGQKGNRHRLLRLLLAACFYAHQPCNCHCRCGGA